MSKAAETKFDAYEQEVYNRLVPIITQCVMEGIPMPAVLTATTSVVVISIESAPQEWQLKVTRQVIDIFKAVETKIIERDGDNG